ncbi:MAG: hypothetical protein F4X44_12400 [Gammaproteobacteria bacterium]|nr:hypothetical protein [Gammaproteobacteria bacterium]
MALGIAYCSSNTYDNFLSIYNVKQSEVATLFLRDQLNTAHSIRTILAIFTVALCLCIYGDDDQTFVGSVRKFYEQMDSIDAKLDATEENLKSDERLDEADKKRLRDSAELMRDLADMMDKLADQKKKNRTKRKKTRHLLNVQCSID